MGPLKIAADIRRIQNFGELNGSEIRELKKIVITKLELSSHLIISDLFLETAVCLFTFSSYPIKSDPTF
jgi:hypothetical protein